MRSLKLLKPASNNNIDSYNNTKIVILLYLSINSNNNKYASVNILELAICKSVQIKLF